MIISKLENRDAKKRRVILPFTLSREDIDLGEFEVFPREYFKLPLQDSSLPYRYNWWDPLDDLVSEITDFFEGGQIYLYRYDDDEYIVFVCTSAI